MSSSEKEAGLGFAAEMTDFSLEALKVVAVSASVLAGYKCYDKTLLLGDKPTHDTVAPLLIADAAV